MRGVCRETYGFKSHYSHQLSYAFCVAFLLSSCNFTAPVFRSLFTLRSFAGRFSSKFKLTYRFLPLCAEKCSGASFTVRINPYALCCQSVTTFLQELIDGAITIHYIINSIRCFRSIIYPQLVTDPALFILKLIFQVGFLLFLSSF